MLPDRLVMELVDLESKAPGLPDETGDDDIPGLLPAAGEIDWQRCDDFLLLYPREERGRRALDEMEGILRDCIGEERFGLESVRREDVLEFGHDARLACHGLEVGLPLPCWWVSHKFLGSCESTNEREVTEHDTQGLLTLGLLCTMPSADGLCSSRPDEDIKPTRSWEGHAAFTGPSMDGGEEVIPGELRVD